MHGVTLGSGAHGVNRGARRVAAPGGKVRLDQVRVGEEVGLFVQVDGEHTAAAARELAVFGESRPAGDGQLGVGLHDGAQAVSAVVRRLDDAGVTVHGLQLREPSLVDVFAEATGYRLEGADATDGDGATARGQPGSGER